MANDKFTDLPLYVGSLPTTALLAAVIPGNSSGTSYGVTVEQIATAAPGSDTQVVFNDNGTLDAVSGWTFDKTAITQEMTSTDAGTAAAPVVSLYRNSPSPAATDVLGALQFYGNDSAGTPNKTLYAGFTGTIISPTDGAEIGAVDFRAINVSQKALIRFSGQSPITVSPSASGVSALAFAPTGTFTATFNYTVTGNNLLLQDRNSGGTLMEFDYTTAATSAEISIGGARGAEALRVTRTASAVTRVSTLGTTTGGSPSLKAQSTVDTNVHLTIGGQGTGTIIISSLPTSAAGLPTGALWNDTGTLKVA